MHGHLAIFWPPVTKRSHNRGMERFRYIFRASWDEAGMIARIVAIVLGAIPAAVATAVTFWGGDWSRDLIPWWGWLSLTAMAILGFLVWNISKRAYDLEIENRPKIDVSPVKSGKCWII